MTNIKIPDAPNSIQKGIPLKYMLDKEAIQQLGINLHIVDSGFKKEAFIRGCLQDIEDLGLKNRAQHIANIMRTYLPQVYSEAIVVLLASLTPVLDGTENNGLAGMFYMPHNAYIATYGVDPQYNRGQDPFEVSMQYQHELTKRFTCEFAIRPFLAHLPDRTFTRLYQWMNDSDSHVRRLCTEGTRPRLPWAKKLVSLADDPSPSFPILENLKEDPELYVRRSVANHVGDIAKDHLHLALDLCEKWLDEGKASVELRWVIRHALRNPAKRKVKRALELRLLAK
jgi:3-methyladenine DNA glycosylase AlkC